MLVGADNSIKPDRTIQRLLHAALYRNLTIEQSEQAIIAAHHLLVQEHATLTPKSLDNLIWRYQRNQ